MVSILYTKTPDMCYISFLHGEYPHASIRLVFPFSSMLAFFYYDVGTFVSSTRLSISTPHAAFFGVKKSPMVRGFAYVNIYTAYLHCAGCLPVSSVRCPRTRVSRSRLSSEMTPYTPVAPPYRGIHHAKIF